MGLKVLITGSNGYVGSSLYRGLNDKHNCYPMTRRDADLRDNRQVSKFFMSNTFDVVVHCAGVGGSRLKKDSFGVMDVNLMMYYNLLDNRYSFKNFINIGSGAEIHAQNTPYGLSKWVIRNSVLEQGWHNLRVFGVFDENELETRFIKASILNVKKGIRPQIFGDGHFDFFYMPDFVTMVNHFINGEQRKEVDVCYKEKYKLSRIAGMIGDGEFHRLDRMPQEYTGKFTDLGLNYIGLEQGIKEVYERINSSNGPLEYRS